MHVLLDNIVVVALIVVPIFSVLLPIVLARYASSIHHAARTRALQMLLA